MSDKLLPVLVLAEEIPSVKESGAEARESTQSTSSKDDRLHSQDNSLDSRGGQNSSTNNVFSPDFVSMMDEHFKADFDNTYKWAPGARSRPRMVEIGMLWDNKVTRKV